MKDQNWDWTPPGHSRVIPIAYSTTSMRHLIYSICICKKRKSLQIFYNISHFFAFTNKNDFRSKSERSKFRFKNGPFFFFLIKL